jgi:hypothetical protein
MDATSRCPAVASAAQPVGVDSSAAAEVLEGLANYFNTPEVKEVVSEAERIKTREEQIALIRRLRPEVTDFEAERLRGMYEHSTHLNDIHRRVKAETGGSELLALGAVAGAQLNEEVWKPMGEVIGPVVKGVVSLNPIAEGAFEELGQAIHRLEGKVGDGLTRLTGSRTFGDAVAPSATQALLAAAPKVPGALKTTERLVRQGATALRNMEVTLDSTAFLRHNAGIPIDAVKIGQKTPKVEVPTPAPTAPKVAEATVSEAPVIVRDYPAATPLGGTGSKTMLVSRGANIPAQINGIQYSGHALDQMQGRGVMPSVVKDILGKIELIVGKRPNTLVFYDPINNITVIKSSSLNQVITVSHGKIKQ